MTAIFQKDFFRENRTAQSVFTFFLDFHCIFGDINTNIYLQGHFFQKTKFLAISQ